MLDRKFTVTLRKSTGKGGWTYAVMPARPSYPAPGPGQGTFNHPGHPFQSTFLAMGDGARKLPVKTGARKAIGKEAGGIVTGRLAERLNG